MRKENIEYGVEIGALSRLSQRLVPLPEFNGDITAPRGRLINLILALKSDSCVAGGGRRGIES